MGMGAMSAVMLTLPLTSVLLPAVMFPSSELTLTPLVIVAVVVAYVTAARLARPGSRAAVPGQRAARLRCAPISADPQS